MKNPYQDVIDWLHTLAGETWSHDQVKHTTLVSHQARPIDASWVMGFFTLKKDVTCWCQELTQAQLDKLPDEQHTYDTAMLFSEFITGNKWSSIPPEGGVPL